MVKKSKAGGFSSAMASHAKAWDEKRKVKDEGPFGQDDEKTAAALRLKDGDSINYPARIVRANCGQDKKGNGYVTFTLVGMEGGPGYKVQTQRKHFLGERKISKGPEKGKVITTDDLLDYLFIDLQRIGYQTDGDDPFTPEDVEEICADISSEKPAMSTNAQFNNGYLSIYLNKALTPEQIEALVANGEVLDEEKDEDESEDETDVAPDEEEEEEDEEDEEEEDEEEEDDEEAFDDEEEPSLVPTKGLEAMWMPPRASKAQSFSITRVNATNKTASLRRERDGKLFKSVSWDDFEIVDED